MFDFSGKIWQKSSRNSMAAGFSDGALTLNLTWSADAAKSSAT